MSRCPYIGTHRCSLVYVAQLKKISEQKSNSDNKTNSIEAEDLAMNDKDEKSEYDEDEYDMESNIDHMTQHMTTRMNVDDVGLSSKSDGKIHDGAKLDLPQVCCARCCFPFIHLD